MVDFFVLVGASSSHAAPPEVSPRSVSFAEVLVAPDDDDCNLLTAEKAPPSEGLLSILRLLVLLCTSVAPAVPPAPWKV